MSEHRVNCGDPYGSEATAMEIRSQAIRQLMEGSTTRPWSLSETVKAHERATPLWGEEIVCSASKDVEVDHKQVGDNNICAGQLASDQTYVVLALRVWLYFNGTNDRTFYQQVTSQLYFTFSLGDKPQFVAPSWYHPAGGGVWSGGADTTPVFNNGVPSQESILKLARPIVIPVRQNISVDAQFFPVGTTNVLTLLNAPATDDEIVILYMIDGLQTRDVQ